MGVKYIAVLAFSIRLQLCIIIIIYGIMHVSLNHTIVRINRAISDLQTLVNATKESEISYYAIKYS